MLFLTTLEASCVLQALCCKSGNIRPPPCSADRLNPKGLGEHVELTLDQDITQKDLCKTVPISI